MFKTAIYITFALLFFSLSINFVLSTNAFPVQMQTEQYNTKNVLQKLTLLKEPSMAYVFGIASTLSLVASLAVCAITRTIVPLGIYVFGQVFWTSWIRMQNILSLGGYIPTSFLTMISIGAIFVFIAAIIGILTGK